MIKVTVKNLPESEVEIEGEIPTEEFGRFRAAAIAKINAEVTIDGFRQGHATEQALIAKVGEEKILLEMAESALQKAYPEIIEQEKLDALGRPNITITKLAKDNPLGFKIKTAISPKIKLGDYGTAAKKIVAEVVEKIEVADKEVDDLIEEITVDAYGDDENLWAFRQAFEDNVDLPADGFNGPADHRLWTPPDVRDGAGVTRPGP